MREGRTLHTEEYRIRGIETDRTGKLSLSGLTNILQETAGIHARVLGFSVEDLQRQGISWLLYRMQLKIDVWPVYGDSLRIETWPSGISGLYAFREFEIWSGSRKLGSASTAWLVFNLSSRKLIKIPEAFGEKIPSSIEGPQIQLKKKIELPSEFESNIKVNVGWQHLDLNNHTNNVHYYAWMMGSVPEKIHVENILVEMDAIFKSETSLGNNVSVESHVDNNKIFHKLSLESGKEVMIAETLWKQN